MDFLQLIGATALWVVATIVAAMIMAFLVARATEHQGLSGLAVLNLAIIGTLGLGAFTWLIWIISMVVN